MQTTSLNYFFSIGILFIAALINSCGKEKDQFVAVDSTLATTQSLPLETNIVATPSPTPPATLSKIQSQCQSKTLLLREFSINFPNPERTCEWGANGNLGRRDGHFQARREQSVVLPVPAQAIICSLELNSESKSFVYDDQFIITFNNYVLAATKYVFTKDWLAEVASNPGTYFYQWTHIAGKFGGTNIAGEKEVYCYGKEQGSACDWPKSQQIGAIKVSPAPAKIQQLIALSLAQGPYELKFITIGDNNNSDCQHTSLIFQARLQYVLP